MFSATKSFFTNEATGGGGGPTPSWSLDFSSGTPSGYTLTRASSGTYVDSSGYVASASTDVARLTHNSSGSRLGLLIEQSGTNVVQRSGEFENAYWADATGTNCAGVSSPASPDNSTDAAELKETTGSASHYRGIYSGAVTNGLSYTFTAYLKKGTRQYCGLYVLHVSPNTGYTVLFDLDNGTVADAASTGTPNGVSSIEAAGNGWYRCRVTLTAAASSSRGFGVFMSDRSTLTGSLTTYKFPNYVGSTSETLYVWGLQFEEDRSTASSYIPTTTASVTRSADLAHVLDSSITNWGDPGALVIHFYAPGQAGTLISTDNASTAQIGIEAQTSATTIRGMWSSGQTATSTTSGTGVQKAVHYWNGTNSRFCLNGGTVQTGTNNLTIGNTDFVTLGAESTESGGTPNQNPYTDYANCIIRKVEFYSGTLTDANLQTITT